MAEPEIRECVECGKKYRVGTSNTWLKCDSCELEWWQEYFDYRVDELTEMFTMWQDDDTKAELQRYQRLVAEHE